METERENINESEFTNAECFKGAGVLFGIVAGANLVSAGVHNLYAEKLGIANDLMAKNIAYAMTEESSRNMEYAIFLGALAVGSYIMGKVCENRNL